MRSAGQVKPFAQEQLEVERRIEDIMSAARRQAVDELECYHAFGRKFTKFDDCEPLEREAILGVGEFDPRVVDHKVDVFGPVAVTTFLMNYAVVAGRPAPRTAGAGHGRTRQGSW